VGREREGKRGQGKDREGVIGEGGGEGMGGRGSSHAFCFGNLGSPGNV